MAPLPQDLVDALDRGELTPGQLRQLIALEAEALGLDFEEAVKRARAGTLPRDAIGADLELLVELLPAA
jgi:hypothetical protein